MTKLLKKILILLMFSVITVTAQDLPQDSECLVHLNECLDNCADSDEPCMEKCDAKYSCPEDNQEILPEL